ncbi:MAG: RnfABCDGE type electron transport complex subunit B [Burkholderiaceae bacterium]
MHGPAGEPACFARHPQALVTTTAGSRAHGLTATPAPFRLPVTPRQKSPLLDPIVEHIDALLPQTQCTRCGYPSCAEYAQAIAGDHAAINRCPPGGEQGIVALAGLLGRPVLPLDPDCGAAGPRLLAFIESEDCIGCTKCIRACPVDAIIGGPKAMHSVLPALCSGCELCVPPCPTDCIRILPIETPWSQADANQARQRFTRRQLRLNRERFTDLQRHEHELSAKLVSLEGPPPAAPDGKAGVSSEQAANAPGATHSERPPSDAARDPAAQRKRAVLDAALARARERLAARPENHSDPET